VEAASLRKRLCGLIGGRFSGPISSPLRLLRTQSIRELPLPMD